MRPNNNRVYGVGLAGVVVLLVMTTSLTAKSEVDNIYVPVTALKGMWFHSEPYENANYRQREPKENHWDRLYDNAPRKYWTPNTEKKHHVDEYVKNMLKERDEQSAKQK